MKRILLVVTCSLLLPVIPFVIVGELPGERWLAHNDQHAIWFGLVGALLLVADILLPVPSSIVGTLLGARLGAPLGALFTMLGLMGSAGLGYALGRLAPERFRSTVAETPSAVVIFLSRPVPIFAEAIALSAGVLRVPPRRFFLASTAGNAIYAAALAINGASQLPGALVGPGLVLPMLVPVAAYLIWRTRTRR